MPKRELKIPGFEKPSNKTKPRLIIAVDGQEKRGKTTFGLSAPAPIAFFNFDEGLEGVIHKFKDKEILISSFMLPADKKVPGVDWKAEWGRFKEEYKRVLTHSEVRTVVIDTATELWELCRMAGLGKLTQVLPHHYGPVNAEMREVIRTAYGYDKNLILLHKMRTQYVNDKWTGKYERNGFKDTGFAVQVNVRLLRKDGQFVCFVKDCRQNMDLCDLELSGGLCNFDTLMSMVFA